jgi:hypothetical protein
VPVIGSTSLEELVKIWEVSAFAGVVMPAFEEEKTWQDTNDNKLPHPLEY